MINDLASLTLYLISKIGKKIKVTRPGYEKSKLLGSLDNWEPGQLSRIFNSVQRYVKFKCIDRIKTFYRKCV